MPFVLSLSQDLKLALRVGTRAQSAQAPVAYEIPREVVAEGIVNAVAHRDYASQGGVQVMLFSDRLEVWNPGRLPSSLTLARLRQPHGSVPQQSAAGGIALPDAIHRAHGHRHRRHDPPLPGCGPARAQVRDERWLHADVVASRGRRRDFGENFGGNVGVRGEDDRGENRAPDAGAA